MQETNPEFVTTVNLIVVLMMVAQQIKAHVEVSLHLVLDILNILRMPLGPVDIILTKLLLILQ